MKNKKIIFLDFDGVVNTPIWDENGAIDYNHPSDGKVNNYQAIMWLNELLFRTKASIVVSSTWRYCQENTTYQDCLYNAGLKKKYEIVGATPILHDKRRLDEIKEYLENHKDIDNYVILDDEYVDDKDHFVKCDEHYGFGYNEFVKALKILNKDK